MTHNRHNANRFARAAMVVVCASSWLLTAPASAQVKYWELEPYRIHVVLAVDVPGPLADQFSAALPEYLADRAQTAIGPAWRLSTSVASGALRHQLLTNLATLPDDLPAEIAPEADKLVLLTVRATPLGYRLAGREYDFYVARWGATIHRQCPQRSALPERLFVLLRDVVAPLARLELDPDDDDRVILQLRGAGLPQPATATPWAKPGQVFLPMLRRTTREGEVIPDGIQVVPWTYVEATEVNGGRVVGQLQSGTRRPLGVRRRGRVEQLAIAIRPELDATTVRLHSRTQPDKPLVGYHIFAQDPDDEAVEPIGVSDGDGGIEIPRGSVPILLLYVKSGDQILARLPVMPGAESLVDVPLPDDDVHQQAQARLAALREELIDVVAQRTILMLRVEQKIEAGQLDQAEELLQQLDDLPSRAQFNQLLSREARLHHSDDPQVQRRIDRLFAATQQVLGQYLDTRPISDLHDQLQAARQGNQGESS